MELVNLWCELTPQPDKLETIKKDLFEGKVPELPYFIIDQEIAKEVISNRLNEIDGTRMQTNLLIAKYGNGKTNLLKYLSLFFQDNDKYNVKVLYSRADIDQTDIFIFLLQSLQYDFLDKLIELVLKIRNENNTILDKLANDFHDNFSAIRDYTNLLFNKENDNETIKEILLLGTGRLYSKGSFSKFGLQQLTNFNRREILVLFLNILSKEKIYILFGIDELEKIHEKSSKRLNHFLTSYRELIDLFNKINGHYLLTCFTDATDSQELNTSNAAFYSRIEGDIIHLESLSNKRDINKLATSLNTLFKTKKNAGQINDITSDILKKLSELNSNRKKIQYISNRLNSSVVEFIDLQSYFINYPNLNPLFNEISVRLELEDAFKNLSRSFFSPLEYYLEALNYQDVENNLFRRDTQSFVDKIGEKIFFFLFNENLIINNELNERIQLEALKHNFHKIIIFSPTEIELGNSQINVDNCDIEIIDYIPKELFTLLVMFKENFDKQKEVAELIHLYTKSNL